MVDTCVYTSQDPKISLHMAPTTSTIIREQASLPRDLVGDTPSMPPEPGLQTSVLAMESGTSLRLDSSPFQPWFRASPSLQGPIN